MSNSVQGQINKSQGAFLSAGNDHLYVNLEAGALPFHINHISWGYGIYLAADRTAFSIGVLHVIEGAHFQDEFAYEQRQPQSDKKELYFDQINGLPTVKNIDFAKPLVIPAGALATIIIPRPLDTGGAGLPALAFLTVRGEFVEPAGPNGERKRGYPVPRTIGG